MKRIWPYLGWVLAPIFAATTAHGQTLTEMSGSMEACHAPAKDISQTTVALAGQGWVLVEGDPAPEIVELLIWPQIAFYATGDTGGEAMSSLAALQRKTVAGFAKKVDIPTSKTRIMHRQIGADREAVLVFWLQDTPTETQIICRFALSAHSLLGQTAGGFGVPTAAETAPGKSFTITPMNAAVLSAEIDAPVTVSGVMQTTAIFEVAE